MDSNSLLKSIVVSIPSAILIPFVGWIFGWYGAIVVIALGLIPAYFFGNWVARRTEISEPLFPYAFGSAVVPMSFALLLAPSNFSDPAVLAWSAIALVTPAMVYFAAARRRPTDRSNSPPNSAGIGGQE
jgi:hypothetical protein